MGFSQLMHLSLACGLLLPLASTLLLALDALIKRPISEKYIANLTQGTLLLYLVCIVLVSATWIFSGFSPMQINLGALFHVEKYAFPISLYVDISTIIFLITTATISNVIIFYSRRYLHRDPGYRRFYMIMSLFIFGMTLVITAGTFDLLFAGWEAVGLSSFLLIGFYWHRPSAALNAKRTYFIYRVCDLGLLMSALISHLVWHEKNLFYALSSGHLLDTWTHSSVLLQWVLSLVILIAVIGKSAQFPVSYWLPRAMEGPTSSSAIFYGSLSIHAGVFLLIRTFSIWHHTPYFNWLVGGVGLTTAVIASLCSRVQTNIKGQIGYASVAQVGIMLIELALGLPYVALIHMVGNAFLRCFQLLVSPSILIQQLQIHSALEGKTLKSRWSLENWLPSKLHVSLYVFALNDGYLESIIKTVIVKPLQNVAYYINFIYNKILLFCSKSSPFLSSPLHASTNTMRSFNFGILTFICILASHFMLTNGYWIQYVLLGIALFCTFSAFGEMKRIRHIINATTLSNALVVGALVTHSAENLHACLFYLLGLAGSWLLSQDSLEYMLKRRQPKSLDQFSGLWGQFPIAGTLMLVGMLGIVGFPISTTFFGEDLLSEHAIHSGWLFLTIFNFIFILNGISLIRAFTRLCFGVREAEIQTVDLDVSRLGAISKIIAFIAINLIAFSIA